MPYSGGEIIAGVGVALAGDRQPLALFLLFDFRSLLHRLELDDEIQFWAVKVFRAGWEELGIDLGGHMTRYQ